MGESNTIYYTMTESGGKRILIFNDGLELGGTEKLLINLLDHLVENKYIVTLLLPFQSEKNLLLSKVSASVLVRYLFNHNISQFRRKIDEVKMIFKTQSFLKQSQIKETDYDMVVCFKEGFYAKLFSEFKIPKILWVHNILYKRKYEVHSFKERLSVWLNKKEIDAVQKSYTFYDKVICVSQACKDSYESIMGSKSEAAQNVLVIPNAIDLDKVRKMSEVDTSTTMPVDKINFVLLTRMSSDKRVDRAIKAAKWLKEHDYRGFHIHILGVEAKDLWRDKDTDRLSLEDVVSVYGQIENPFPYVKKADWLICVSERESFSLVLLEAMSLGVPVLTTDCGGPTEIIENGKYGLLVENSTSGVCMGMKRVIDDGNLKNRYSKELEQIVQKYNCKHWLASVDEVLVC